MITDMKNRPRSHWAASQRSLRKKELAFIHELRHEAHNRAKYRLDLQNIDSLLHHKLYRPELRPSMEARKAALSAAIKESLGN